MGTHLVRRAGAVLLIAAIAAVLLAGCGDGGGGSTSDDTPPESSTTETSAVFDPDQHGAGGSDEPEDDGGDATSTTDSGGSASNNDCQDEPGEDNLATLVNDRIQCELPDIDDISVISAGGVLDVVGDWDPGDAVTICEVAVEYLTEEQPDQISTVTVSYRFEAGDEPELEAQSVGDSLSEGCEEV